MEILGIKTSLFMQHDSLFEFIIKHVPVLNDGDILVVTSKIVALSEGRVRDPRDKEKIIREESLYVIETPWEPLAFTSQGWCIGAGIDASNANNKIILLPLDAFESARKLRVFLQKHFSVKKLGVIITDSRSTPLRVGTIGRAIGYAGFKPLKNYIGKKDLFGRKSRVTQSNVADALASTTVLIMGEGDECTPLAIIKNASIEFINRKLSKKEMTLSIPPELDIFSYVFIKK